MGLPTINSCLLKKNTVEGSIFSRSDFVVDAAEIGAKEKAYSEKNESTIISNLS